LAGSEFELPVAKTGNLSYAFDRFTMAGRLSFLMAVKKFPTTNLAKAICKFAGKWFGSIGVSESRFSFRNFVSLESGFEENDF
jgi:hypothetical protein